MIIKVVFYMKIFYSFRLSKNQFQLGILVPLIRFSLSCRGLFDDSNKEFVKYLLTIGSTWEYDVNRSMYYYSDTTSLSPTYEDSSSIYWTSRATIVGEMLLQDTINPLEFYGAENIANYPYYTKRYYKESIDGLFQIGYTPYSTLTLPKITTQSTYSFNEMEFHSIKHLIQYIENPNVVENSSRDSINTSTPPRKVLEYPLSIGSEWMYSPQPFEISKKVTSYKQLDLNNQLFNCYEVTWLYDLDQNGLVDSDIKVIDYISNKGLILRKIFIYGIKVSNLDGIPTGQLVDYIQINRLVNYDIP